MTVIDMTDPRARDFIHMVSVRGALLLELNGMTRRGRSAYAIAKETWGFKGNKERVYNQLCELIEKEHRRKRAELIRELRKMPTPHLTIREKNRAIRSHARKFLRGVQGEID